MQYSGLSLEKEVNASYHIYPNYSDRYACRANTVDPAETPQMRRLLRTFVVRICPESIFLHGAITSVLLGAVNIISQTDKSGYPHSIFRISPKKKQKTYVVGIY